MLDDNAPDLAFDGKVEQAEHLDAGVGHARTDFLEDVGDGVGPGNTVLKHASLLAVQVFLGPGGGAGSSRGALSPTFLRPRGLMTMLGFQGGNGWQLERADEAGHPDELLDDSWVPGALRPGGAAGLVALQMVPARPTGRRGFPLFACLGTPLSCPLGEFTQPGAQARRAAATCIQHQHRMAQVGVALP